MRYLVCIMLLFSINTSAQKNRTPPPSEYKIENDSCIRKSNLPVSKRLKNYPFNKAKSVLLVSFNYYIPSGIVDSITNHSEANDRDVPIVGLPIINGRLDTKLLKEQIQLNETQINSLTDILYNYVYKEQHNFITHSCYEPRNAIVFLNSKDKILDYIEICFNCEEIWLSSKKVSAGNFCVGKYALLKEYFKSVGIRKGVTND